MGKMKEYWEEHRNKDSGDDTYIEWCMRYQNTPDKYTPSYENWWNKKYGTKKKKVIYKNKIKGANHGNGHIRKKSSK